MAGRDLVGQAHTGSGKTLAFGLPLIEKCDPRTKEVQALVLAPTRELALQVGEVMTQLAKPAGLNVAIIYGGVGMSPQLDALERGSQIVIGTPGRILDHLRRRSLKLNQLRVMILDEADQMLDKGFAPDVEAILSCTPRSRQTALFSATTPDWVRRVSAHHLNEPEFLEVEPEETAPDIEHTVVEMWSGDKLSVLLALLDQPSAGATLVFGRTRHGVMNLARRLNQRGYEVEALQGDLGQQARERIIKKFRAGRLPVLLATNVAARGLDILNVDRVINYDLPETPELFVHRVGRTGRMGQSGQAITIIDATDLQKMQEIERHLGRKLPRVAPAQLHKLQRSLPDGVAPAIVDDFEDEHDDEAAPVTSAPAVSATGEAVLAGGEVRKRRRRRSRSRSAAAPQDAAPATLQVAPA